MSVGNDFAADAAADAAIAGFAKLGVVKGTIAAVATPVVAAVGTAAMMALPLVIVGGVFYFLTRDDETGKAAK